MKKCFLAGLIALLGLFVAGAEPFTKASGEANVEKFLNGKGNYIKIVRSGKDKDSSFEILIQKSFVQGFSMVQSEDVFGIIVDGVRDFLGGALGVKPIVLSSDPNTEIDDDDDDDVLAFYVKDVSIDANGNLIFKLNYSGAGNE